MRGCSKVARSPEQVQAGVALGLLQLLAEQIEHGQRGAVQEYLALEQEVVPHARGQVEGQVLGEEGEQPLGQVDIGRDIQRRQVLVHHR